MRPPRVDFGRAAAAALLICLLGGAAAPPRVEGLCADLPLNQVQYIGTHNSYHRRPDRRILDALAASDYRQNAVWTGRRLAEALDYEHPSLTQQLDAGLRNFEIDVYRDPDGGRFAHPGIVRTLAKSTFRAPDEPPQPLMAAPGFKVMHMADIDYRSNCWTLKICLEQFRHWSDAHPGHLPIVLMIETKEGGSPPFSADYTAAEVLTFDPKAWSELETSVRQELSAPRIVTPDEVRRGEPTLRAAIERYGWPALSGLAGRFVLTLNSKPRALDAYLKLHAAGHGGLFFFDHGLDDPETTWVFRSDPYKADIAALMHRGYLVYTRADADGLDREPQRSQRREQALSRAFVISTDFSVADEGTGGYQVRFPDQVQVRPNASFSSERRPTAPR